jgi:hypothetical protein
MTTVPIVFASAAGVNTKANVWLISKAPKKMDRSVMGFSFAAIWRRVKSAAEYDTGKRAKQVKLVKH